MKFQIPAASLNIFSGLSVILLAAFYDRLFIPLARDITGNPNGKTALQRIGGGIFLSAVCMVGAAIVERKRLQTAMDFGLVDMPDETVPTRVWWVVPQYLLTGVAGLFTGIGLQELFYEQVPNGLKSMGFSLILSMFAVGFFIMASLYPLYKEGHDGWFSDNLNHAHLNYYNWLLAGISALEMIVFLCYSKSLLH